MDIQVILSGWLSHLAGILPFGYGFGAGMVAAVNPCGFAMLPVYLTMYLGAQSEEYKNRNIIVRLLQAVWVTMNVTLGFGLLFFLGGGIILFGGQFFMEYIPWFALIVGGILVGAGLWLLFGHHISFSFFSSFAAKLGDPRKTGFVNFFLFGLGFGITSMSCTLPIFLAVVGSSITQGDYAQGMGQFLAFIAGISSVLLSVTVAIACVKEGLVVRHMKKVLPYVHYISAIFLLAAGCYILYYWISSGLL